VLNVLLSGSLVKDPQERQNSSAKAYAVNEAINGRVNRSHCVRNSMIESMNIPDVAQVPSQHENVVLQFSGGKDTQRIETSDPVIYVQKVMGTGSYKLDVTGAEEKMLRSVKHA